MNVLIACEYSGEEREAFTALGHYAVSCDFLPTDRPGRHYRGDVREIIGLPWDLMIAHPTCTFMTVAGIHWNKNPNHKRGQNIVDGLTWGERETRASLEFVRFLLGQDHIPKICLENPISVISTQVRKPDQIVQPYHHGHTDSKATCYWLKGLPLLTPTKVMEPPAWRCCNTRLAPGIGCVLCGGSKTPKPLWGNMTPGGQNKLGPSEDRWKIRSTTYSGIARAMAAQWGGLSPSP
jgi:hypothetical protein